MAKKELVREREMIKKLDHKNIRRSRVCVSVCFFSFSFFGEEVGEISSVRGSL